jgi:hypothetical protein
MSINSHLSTCVGTQSPKYLEMAHGHISLSVSHTCGWVLDREFDLHVGAVVTWCMAVAAPDSLA